MSKEAKTPKKACCHPGCGTLTELDVSYCEIHKKKKEKQRGTANQRGYTYGWQQASRAFSRKNPLCVSCDEKGIVTAAEVVDHIIPHQGDKILFWDKSNWQGLCKKCHDHKTSTEDGGFGR